MPNDKKPAPAANAPAEEHRKHAEEFLTREEHKRPKDPKRQMHNDPVPADG